MGASLRGLFRPLFRVAAFLRFDFVSNPISSCSPSPIRSVASLRLSNQSFTIPQIVSDSITPLRLDLLTFLSHLPHPPFLLISLVRFRSGASHPSRSSSFLIPSSQSSTFIPFSSPNSLHPTFHSHFHTGTAPDRLSILNHSHWPRLQLHTRSLNLGFRCR